MNICLHRLILCVSILLWSPPTKSQNYLNVNEIDGVFFSVQVGTYSTSIAPPIFAEYENELIRKELENDLFRFSIGVQRDMLSARLLRDKLIDRGFDDALVIAYENGQRVSLKELRDRELPANQQTVMTGTALKEIYSIEVMDIFENEILEYEPFNISENIQAADALLSPTASHFDEALIEPSSQVTLPLGVNISSYYANNLNNGFSNYEDLFFTERLNIGLEWDLLSGGLIENRIQKKRIENLKAIASIEGERALRNAIYRDQYTLLILLFQQEKESTLNDIAQLSQRLSTVKDVLFTSRKATWSEVIEARATRDQYTDELARVQELCALLEHQLGTNTGVQEELSARDLPILQIETRKLLSDTGLVNDEERIQAYKTANNELHQGLLTSATLRPFANYNLTEDINANSQNFATVGIALKLPIANAKQLKTSNSQHFKIESESAQSSLRNKLINLYLDYERKYQYLTDVQRLRVRLESELRTEVIRYQLDQKSFSVSEGLTALISLKENQLDLLDAQMQLYHSLLEMSMYREDQLSNYTRTANLTHLAKMYPQARHTRFGEEFFYAHDNLFLIHYLKSNEIVRVDIPLSNQNKKKWSEFIQLCKKNNIQVLADYTETAILDDFDEANLELYLEKIRNSDLDGISLNISPHDYTDFEGRTDYYLSNYIDIVQFSRNSLGSLYLVNTTLSTSYPMEWLERFYSTSDWISLVITPIEGPYRTAERVRSSNLEPESTTISIAAKYFANRLYMENFIEELSKQITIESVLLNNLEDVYKLDYQATFENE